jgi:hypothetical protein
MNRRTIASLVYASILTTGAILLGVGCGLGIVPVTLLGVFLVGAGAVGFLLTRMY